MRDASIAASYFIDAPALYPPVLKLGSKILEYAGKLAILDLTVYEIRGWQY